jgi:MFS family permease
LKQHSKRSTWAAFRDNPQFQRLFVSRTISLLGDWFNALAIVYLLGVERSTAMAIAIVFVLKQVPVFLLGPVAGVLADRFDRKKIMIGCNLIAAGLVLCFLLFAIWPEPMLLYVLVALQLSVTTFFEPARQSVFPSVVQKRDLTAANALSAASWSVMFTLGSFAGGVVLAFFGWQAAIVVDALTYLVSAAILWRLNVPPREKPADAELEVDSIPATGQVPERRDWRRLLGIEDVVLGLRYIVRTREVLSIILVKFGWGTMGVVTLLLTLLGRSESYQLGGREELGISFLWGCRGLGTLLGPFMARAYAGEDSERMKRSLTFAYFFAPAMYVAIWLGPQTWWYTGALVFVAHLAGSTLWVISTVLLQQIVPESYRGRTFAAELGLVMFSSAMSQIAYALLIDYGVLSLWACFLVAPIVCLLPAWVWLRNRHRERQEMPASV